MLSYKDFIREGMRMMGVKGRTAEVVREAMGALAREWVRRKLTNTLPSATASEVADKLLGRK